MFKEIEYEKTINLAANLEKKDQEELLNLLLVPLYDNIELFETNSFSYEVSQEKLIFWIDYFQKLSDKISSLAVPLHYGFPKPHPDNKLIDEIERFEDKDYHKYIELVNREFEIDNKLREANNKINEVLNPAEMQSQIDQIKLNYIIMIEKYLGIQFCHSVNIDLQLSFVWRSFTKAQKQKLMELLSRKDEELTSVREQYNVFERLIKSSENLQPIFKEKAELRSDFSLLFGKYNIPFNETAQNGNFLKLLSKSLVINHGINELVSELKYVQSGFLSPLIQSCTNRKAGQRDDTKPVKALKQQAGIVYRALMYSNSNAKDAEEIINEILRENKVRFSMGTKSLQGYAPADLLDLPPNDHIHISCKVIKKRKLPSYDGENYRDCLKRYAALWFKRDIENYKKYITN